MDKPEGSLVGKQPPADAVPARPLDTYVGEYANAYWGPAQDHRSQRGIAAFPRSAR